METKYIKTLPPAGKRTEAKRLRDVYGIDIRLTEVLYGMSS